jgi:hypothetical protein
MGQFCVVHIAGLLTASGGTRLQRQFDRHVESHRLVGQQAMQLLLSGLPFRLRLGAFIVGLESVPIGRLSGWVVSRGLNYAEMELRSILT